MRMSAFGTKRTCRDVFYLSAFGGKADINSRWRENVSIFAYCDAACKLSKRWLIIDGWENRTLAAT